MQAFETVITGDEAIKEMCQKGNALILSWYVLTYVHVAYPFRILCIYEIKLKENVQCNFMRIKMA